MGSDMVPSDTAVLDLLRKTERMTVSELAAELAVTATAVRQRLTRLMAHGLIERDVHREGRGRPSHQYRLTTKGRRRAGANFSDLAIALWQEVRSISDPDVRKGLLGRISHRLVALYGDRVSGETVAQRMESLVQLMRERQIPFEVEERDGLPVLNALACPYPDLADADRAVCAMERQFVAEAVGHDVRLERCRLDGDECCSFGLRTAAGTSSESASAGLVPVEVSDPGRAFVN